MGQVGSAVFLYILYGEIDMEKWVVAAKRADFKSIAEKFHIDQVTARLIRNRDIIGDEEIEIYLNGSLLHLHSPWLMKGMEKTVEILMEKIDHQKKIRIIGDYDIDGVTATYLFLTGLKRCGADVDYEIPDRIKDGYGINQQLIDQAYEEGVDTILTCDNGISAMDQIAYAKDLGMTVLVTDHHELRTKENGDQIEVLVPKADAVVNPHQPGCGYPYKNLCGAAVAFKVISALYESMGIPWEECEALIEFAAIATVGDVMDLTGENRILVREGLLQLNHTSNPGLRALIQVNGLEDKEINSYHIGFVLGPCINASGRLDTAKRALELLLTESEIEATEIAEELLHLNAQRKEMTLEGYEKAVELIETTELKNDRVLVVYLPDCHESLAGIIAGRIRERYYRPVFVLTDGENCVKGSGRSIETYSMFAEMQKCGELFLNYGGHPMAAGCSLEKENVELLRKTLNEKVLLTEDDLTQKIVIDVPMPIDYITEKLIEELELLEPFGKGNHKPVFAERNLKFLNARVLGQNRNVLKFQVENSSGKVMDAMYFGDVDEFRSNLEDKFGYEETEKLYQGRRNNVVLSVIYYPAVNEFRDSRTIQIVIQHYC